MRVSVKSFWVFACDVCMRRALWIVVRFHRNLHSALIESSMPHDTKYPIFRSVQTKPSSSNGHIWTFTTDNGHRIQGALPIVVLKIRHIVGVQDASILTSAALRRRWEPIVRIKILTLRAAYREKLDRMNSQIKKQDDGI